MGSKRQGIAAMALPTSACALLLAACNFASSPPDKAISEKPRNSLIAEYLRRGPEPPSGPEELSIQREETGPANEIEGLRRRALKHAAQTYGSQNGYVRRAWEIQGILERRGRELSRTYDFRLVARPAPSGAGYVIPPSVSLSVNLVRTETADIAVAADEQFEIAEKGRLAPMVPTWRDYLLFFPQTPASLPESLKPVGDGEEDFFRNWLELGWNAGIEQANAELEARLSRLRQDYEGMLLYRKLTDRGKIERLALESTGISSSAAAGILRTGERAAWISARARFRVGIPEYSPGAHASASGKLPKKHPLK